MGYTTDFDGVFTLDRRLAPEHAAYLADFNVSRRMKRDATLTEQQPDPVRLAVGLPVGIDGGYFVGAAGDNFGQGRTDDVLDYNSPPFGQPGVWCRWGPTDSGTGIEWDGGEKFYDYTEWIAYLVEHFLKPWGYVLNGEVEWQGEESDDFGVLVVQDNRVGERPGVREFAAVKWSS